MRTCFRVEFKEPSGTVYRLDTTDPEKIGPWIAEMFGIMPWHPNWGPLSPVTITTFTIGI